LKYIPDDRIRGSNEMRYKICVLLTFLLTYLRYVRPMPCVPVLSQTSSENGPAELWLWAWTNWRRWG